MKNIASSGSDFCGLIGIGYNNLTSYYSWRTGSSGNLVYDSSKPLFVGKANKYYRILSGSQAFNAGSNEKAIEAGLAMDATDQAGNPRFFSFAIDIGAYEYNYSVTTQPDCSATTPGAPVTIDVLTNDSSPESSVLTLSAEGLGVPSHGKAAILDNKIVYTPNEGFSGVDIFTYTMVDSYGVSDVGRVIVTVLESGILPEAATEIVFTSTLSDQDTAEFLPESITEV